MKISNRENGFTLLELLIIITLISILSVAVYLFVNPEESRQRARDVKRLSDLTTLDRAINEYVRANNVYPGTLNVLRISTVLPASSVGLANSAEGWVGANLSPFISKMPIDPLNTSSFYYSYIHDSSSYELNAKLEYESGLMSADGGNDANTYEIGNNLSLISP